MTKASPVPVEKPLSRRCLCCRLPADVRGELVERARLRGWATYAQIAENVSARGFRLSEAAVRRHLRHVDKNRYFDSESGDPADPANTPTPFDHLIGAEALSDRAVCEVMVRALLERVQRLEQARRATHDPVRAETLMRHSREELHALERALRRLAEVRKPRDELKRLFGEIIDRLSTATADACRAAMEEHVQVLTATADEYVGEQLRPESLMRRLARFQAEWPDTLRASIMAATVPIIREAQAALQ